MTEPIRLFLTDDHEIVRAGLRLLLQSDHKLTIVGEASTTAETLEKLQSCSADILILDISMPDQSGLDCLPELRSSFPEMKVLVLSMHASQNYVHRTMQLGAMGYIHKASADVELFDAIHAVQKEQLYISRALSLALVGQAFNWAQNASQASKELPLSVRESEVLRYIALGYSTTETAELLRLNVKTVDTYKTRIMNKLNFTKKSQIVQYALKNGILNRE